GRGRAGTGSASRAPDSGAPRVLIYPLIQNQANLDAFARQTQPERPPLAEFIVRHAPPVLPDFQPVARATDYFRGAFGARPRLHPVREAGERKPPAQRLLGQAFHVGGAVFLVVAGDQSEAIALAADARDPLAQG